MVEKSVIMETKTMTAASAKPMKATAMIAKEKFISRAELMKATAKIRAKKIAMTRTRVRVTRATTRARMAMTVEWILITLPHLPNLRLGRDLTEGLSTPLTLLTWLLLFALVAFMGAPLLPLAVFLPFPLLTLNGESKGLNALTSVQIWGLAEVAQVSTPSSTVQRLTVLTAFLALLVPASWTPAYRDILLISFITLAPKKPVLSWTMTRTLLLKKM
jgi:hypothetical protein